MLLFRRYLVLSVLFFWQGGFTFYAGVVVPVGQEVFGHLRQGFVTRQVTVYLNLAGVVALTILLWEQFVARAPERRHHLGRWFLWLGMLLTLLLLFWLHGQMNELLVPKGRIVRDPDLFRLRHRFYLWISTVQWACALLYLFLMLIIWRRQDQAVNAGNGC